jgi:hypothetical protein
MRNLVEMTADVAFAVATDFAYGNAVSPRQWLSPDEREEAFWDKLRELLGYPPEEKLQEMLWEHRHPIWRILARTVAYSIHGYAVTVCKEIQPVQGELPL